MRKIGVAAAAIALLAVLAVLPAAAQAATKKTTIVFDNAQPVGSEPLKRGGVGGPQDFLVAGHLRSADKCLNGRSMKLVAVRGGNARTVDRDRSSRAGAWSFRATLNPMRDELKISVRRSKAGGDVCGGDALRLGGGMARAASGG